MSIAATTISPWPWRQTDVKGDRSLHPHQQEHPDYYVRIVDENRDGIVVRGAKAHTTNTVCANELMVIPTRTLGPEDQEYAVAFAVPMDAKGLQTDRQPRSAIPITTPSIIPSAPGIICSRL